jgi:plasmid stabilization system protein ParE
VKKYEVIVTPEAETGIGSAFEFMWEQSPESAAEWLRAVYRKIQTLETMPARCARAREDQYLEHGLKQLLFQSHRIIFRIEKRAGIVRILHVRHVKQRSIGEPAPDETE